MAPNGGAFVVVAICVGASLMVSYGESSEPLNWVSIEAKGSYILGPLGKGCEAIPNTFEVSADGTWAKASEFDLQGSMDNDCGIEIHLTIPLESEDFGTGMKQNITMEEGDFEIEVNECQLMKNNITRRKDDLNRRRREYEDNESEIMASFQKLKDAKKSFDEELDTAKYKEKIKEDIKKMKEKVDVLHEAVLTEDKKALKLKEANLAADNILSKRENNFKEKDSKYKNDLTEYGVQEKKMEKMLSEMRQLYGNCEKLAEEEKITLRPECIHGLDEDVKICTP